MQSIETNTAEVILYEGNYVVIRYKYNAIVGINEALEIYEKTNELTHFAKIPALVDARKLKEISREARRFQGNKQSTENAVAVAIMVNSLTTRIIANLFITFQKPTFPIKVFSNQEDAIAWLTPYINKLSSNH